MCALISLCLWLFAVFVLGSAALASRLRRAHDATDLRCETMHNECDVTLVVVRTVVVVTILDSRNR